MIPPAYRLLLCDLRSDELLDVLPVQDVSFDDWIGKAGALTGTIPIPDAGIAARARETLLPGRTAVWVERGRELVWGGILWTRMPASDDRGRLTVQVQVGGWETYLEHRRVFDTQIAAGVDQFDIARGLVDYAQNMTGGDIGIQFADGDPSGVVRDRTYLRYDQATIAELITELGAVDNGFEWRIASRRTEAGQRQKVLELGHPVIETPGADIVLTRPGPILTYSLPEDATGQANVWQARGATINTNQAATSYPLLSPALVGNADLADGWPRLDGVSDYSTVSVQSTLTAHANADWAAARRPVTIPEVTVLLGDDVGPALLGRAVRLRIRDYWHPDTFDARYRVIGITVSPPQRGRPETARLYLEAA